MVKILHIHLKRISHRFGSCVHLKKVLIQEIKGVPKLSEPNVDS